MNIDNYCPVCHTRDVVEIDDISPSKSMDVSVEFKCNKCGATFRTEYGFGSHTIKE